MGMAHASSDNPTRLMIADDDSLIRAGIKKIVSAHSDRCES